MNQLELPNRTIKSATEYNQKLDDFLIKTKFIPYELVESFDEAYGYDAATTITWLINKIKILDERIKNGELIELEGRGVFGNRTEFQRGSIQDSLRLVLVFRNNYTQSNERAIL